MTAKCNGNCMDCLPIQRQYCATQLAYNNMKQMDILIGDIKEMKDKIEAMQNNEATLFNPTAQEGDGVL